MLRCSVLASFVVLLTGPGAPALEPVPPKPVPPEQFAKIHQLIKPGADESRWKEVPWLLNAIEARQKAAAEGKPILSWYGGGSPPSGAC
jgi:hypothetical protein